MVFRSIRSRLLLALTASALLVITLGTAFTYALVRQHLFVEFDHFLEDKLRYHQISAVQNGNVASFLISQPVWERIHDPDDPEFFQFRYEDGRDVYQSYGISEAGQALPRVGLGDDAGVASDCILPNGREGRCMGLVFTPERMAGAPAGDPMRLHLVVARDREKMNAALSRLRLILLGAGMLAAVLTVLAAVWIVNRALKPVGVLSSQIAAMPVGGEGERFDLPHAPVEIEPVVDRLNDLLGRVDGAIEHERQFTSNAAHELRNPLAGLRSQLELALGAARNPAADEETLTQALKIQRQMEGVVSNLLALARLDAGSEALERQAVNPKEVLRRAWKPYFETAAERELSVKWDLDRAPATLQTAPALFEILVSNLLDNATSYVPDKGQIEITAEEIEGQCRLAVKNTNPGVSEQDLERLRKRFGRGDSSAAGGDHAGIGLSLCDRICSNLGGELELSVDTENFCISAVLPII